MSELLSGRGGSADAVVNVAAVEFRFGALVLETLRSRFGHLTANAKPRFAVSDFTLAVCPYLGLKPFN